MELTHINDQGRAKMVDVGNKENSLREAVARCYIHMKKETLEKILDRNIKKGDVLSVAQVAGIMACKKTPDIIPMCHSIMISACDINFQIHKDENMIEIKSIVRTNGQTGVEMEALMAVSAAALTVYDMCKAIDREMIISQTMLVKKSGGKSGNFENSQIK